MGRPSWKKAYLVTKKIDEAVVVKLFYKYLIYNQMLNISKSHVVLILTWYYIMKRSSSVTQFQSRCLITNYKRSVYRCFRLTRMKIKEYGLAGLINGLRKSSW